MGVNIVEHCTRFHIALSEIVYNVEFRKTCNRKKTCSEIVQELKMKYMQRI